MKLHVLFYFLTLIIAKSSFSQNKIGLFDNHLDIGDCQNSGFAHYDPERQTYTIGGSGKNMWFDEDHFHYLWTTLQGDFILRAEVYMKGSGVNSHRKAGWVIRNTLDKNSAHVNAAVHGDGLTALQYRRTAGGNTEEIVSPDSLPSVIQLERKGNMFIMSTAEFGSEMMSVHLDSMPLDKEVYVGIYVCSHDPVIVETAVFRNVRIIIPPHEGFQPYTDYLGSNLEILDIENGLRKIIHRNAHSIQAPNWTPDSERLIYNSKGKLYNYLLNSATITPLNTGFANRNNNDHVLTFDGRWLGISHHSPENSGQSTIYYLSAEGDSTPVLVTKPGKGASYLHGWSPDNRKMIFTGNRNGQYDIYAVDVDTGEETQLTDQQTLDDGSEYSPDGRYIFFNSARTGTMQLWRMKPDGSEQTQLTFDEYNDWFPHVSPDQKWIVFLSYPKEIPAGDHPFYKHCYLRIIPFDGGDPKVLAYLYGGQGTINVPSWSPDGKKIAFVTNTKL